MAVIWRALATAVLALYGYVVWTGLAAGEGGDALAHHLRAGLLGTIVACLVNSVPFAYFLGTRFWVKAFVRASGAGEEWNRRHDLWMEGRPYAWMYAAAFGPAATGIVGGLVDSRGLPVAWHVIAMGLAVLAQLQAWLHTPRVMRRNSALMDELAQAHHVPRPGTPQMQAWVEREQAAALPPAFQLSRVLMWGGLNLVAVWLYLRFGTEGWRGVPLLPFALAASLLVAVGIGFNARFDPDAPASPRAAWARALVAGVTGVVASLLAAFAGI